MRRSVGCQGHEVPYDPVPGNVLFDEWDFEIGREFEVFVEMKVMRVRVGRWGSEGE